MEKFEIKDGVAIIPEGTTEIGDNAFDCCTALESIILPDSVTFLGENAFRCCTSLTTTILPVGMREIDVTAFYKCPSLSAIIVPAKKTGYYKERLPEKLHDKIVELNEFQDLF